MCGIIGIVAKQSHGFSQKLCDTFTQMLYADAIRGWDATGVFGVNKLGNIDIKKQASTAGHFINTPEYERFIKDGFNKYQIMVGHNRKATHGERKNADAHPFWDSEDKIVLVHNGMISNHKDFCKESTVDSAAIANALATRDTEDVISSIQGAFTLIWYNTEEKKLYMVRNTLRPLYVSETSGAFILASEDSLSYWISKRNGENITQNLELKPWTLYSISLEERKLIEEKEITPKKQIYPVVIMGNGVVTTGTTNSTPTNEMTSIINSYPLEDAEDTYYINTADVPDIQKVRYHIKQKDQVLVTIDSYETLGKNSVKLQCSLLNVKRDFIKILLYVNSEVFGPMDLMNAFSVTVNNIIETDNTITLYVSTPTEVDTTETQNGVLITDSMWYDKRFPCHCDICDSVVQWKDLPKSEVLISKKTDFVLLCPSCT